MPRIPATPRTERQEKTCFRQTLAWKDWRRQLLEAVGYRCELCGVYHRGKSSRVLNIHHKDMDPANYRVLERDRFLVVCEPCHEYIHLLYRRYWNAKNKLENKVLLDLVKIAFLIEDRK